MATTNIQKFAGDVEVSGTVTGDGSGLTTLNGSQVTTGTVAAARIANLDGSKITTGTVAAARIANLDAAKITSGELGADRIPDLDAAKITSGTITTAVDTANDVKAASLYTDRYIYHEGDTNTYMDFSSADAWRVVTGGSQRMQANSSGVNVSGSLTHGNYNDITGGSSGGYKDIGNNAILLWGYVNIYVSYGGSSGWSWYFPNSLTLSEDSFCGVAQLSDPVRGVSAPGQSGFTLLGVTNMLTNRIAGIIKTQTVGAPGNVIIWVMGVGRKT